MMENIVRRVVKKLISYRADRLTLDFIKHNLRCFARSVKAENPDGSEVLFEFNWLHPSHIAYSYLANVLASKYNARIIAYETNNNPSLFKKIEWELSRCLSLRDFAVYRSFGVSEFCC